MEYEAVIGLETHVQLKTRSKMWCGCANEFGAPPNTHVCPVCLGMPGVLPVANEEALRLTALAGLLLNCTVSRFAKFDRKNYFYPDVAKNYQITQFDQPSTVNGHVEFEFLGGIARVRITRAHLEEDVGKNFHFERNSGVDFNRAGVPLLEIVSEPDLTSADMAYEYLNALKDILIYGGISDCDMEKGMVRCDVNVSVRPKGAKELGAKIEIKNMNSFSGARKALDYEIPRQMEVVRSGGKLIQSTRRWDDVTGITEEMRTKEHAHDYRYFPEPDLMPFVPTEAWLEEVSRRVVELPLARKRRFITEYSLTNDQAEYFKTHVQAGERFEKSLEGLSSRFPEDASKPQYLRAMANTIIQQFEPRLTAIVGSLVDLVVPLIGTVAGVTVPFVRTEISSSGYQQLINEVFRRKEDNPDPDKIIVEMGLRQVSDTGAIEKFCDDVIGANPGPVADYRSGKVAALNFLKGQVMKLSQGKANPNVVGEVLERKLKS